jgi:GNAT superfamily N-acetyltransferase
MLSTPRIEIASLADVDELVTIRSAQRWHTNRGLLTATLGWEGCRSFVIHQGEQSDAFQGHIAAAVFALVAGPVGTIGNVVVRPDLQHSGLGRRIMEAALTWQRGRGARSVQLDATHAGRSLYRRLGFVPVGAYSWFAHAHPAQLHRERLLDRANMLRATLRTAREIGRVADLDAMAFGGDRIALLARTLEVAPAWLYMVDDASGTPDGYIMARLDEGRDPIVRIGPWVASAPAAAAALLAALLDRQAPWRAVVAPGRSSTLAVSMPGYNPDALILWQLTGAPVELDDLIMQLDFGDAPDLTPAAGPPRPFAPHPEWTYAFLSSMTL